MAQDKAGNDSDKVMLTPFKVDRLAPGLEGIMVDKNSLKAGEEVKLTFKFSEDVDNFGQDDLEITGGQLSELTKLSADTFTAIYKPVQGVLSGSGVVRLKGTNVFTDLAGNPNLLSGPTQSFTYDTAAPDISSIALGSWSPDATTQGTGLALDSYLNANELKTGTVTFTVKFSEKVSGLSSSNFALFTPARAPIPGLSMAFEVPGGGVSPSDTWTVRVGNLPAIDPSLHDGLKLELTNALTIQDERGNLLRSATYAAGSVFSIDAVAPAQPVLTSGEVAGSLKPRLIGQAEPNSQLTVTFGQVTYTVNADSAGFWVVDTSRTVIGQTVTGTQTLTNGQVVDVSYFATDVAGNQGPAGSARVSINTQAPVIENFGAIKSPTPTVRGSGPANTDILVGMGGATYKVRSDANGQWFITAGDTSDKLVSGLFTPVSSGSLFVTASIANNAQLSTSTRLLIDTVAPSVPVITSSAFTNNPTPTIEGSAEPLSIVSVTVGSANFETRADAQGRWLIDTNPATQNSQTVNGKFITGASLTVIARAADIAGNVSAQVSQSLSIDRTAPSAATIDALGTTGSNTPVLSGGGEVGASVVVEIKGAKYSVIVDTLGRWQVNTATDTPISGAYNAPTSAEPDFLVKATQTDRAGNPQSQPTTATATYDSSFPVITSSLYTNLLRPVITGTAKSGEALSLSIAGGTYAVTADANGNWQFNSQNQSGFPDLSDPSGIYALTVSYAGSATKKTTQSLRVDRTAPTLTVSANPIAGDNVINASEQSASISGTVEAGASVVLSLGNLSRKATINSDGTWRYQFNSEDLAQLGQSAAGQTDDRGLIVTATDRAGNFVRATRSVTIDTLAPQIDLDRATPGSDYFVAYTQKNVSYLLNNRSVVTQTDAEVTELQPVTKIQIAITLPNGFDGTGEALQIGDQSVPLSGKSIPASISYAGISWALSFNSGVLTLEAGSVPNDALAARALLRNLRYINTSAGQVGAGEGDRVFGITVYDRAGNASKTARTTVTADSVGPVIDLNGASAGLDRVTPTPLTVQDFRNGVSVHRRGPARLACG